MSLLPLLGQVSSAAKASEIPITGIARITFGVGDLEKAKEYYGRMLGLPIAVESNAGMRRLAFKVNDDQFLEFLASPDAGGQARFLSFAFSTSDMNQLVAVLIQRGLAPAAPVTDRDGNLSLSLKDPDGNAVEFVQYMPGSSQFKARGPIRDDRRISDHLLHVGLGVSNLDKGETFYRDILGCQVTHRGPEPKVTIVIMRAPGPRADLVEIMLPPETPPAGQRGSQHHISLEITDVQKAVKTLLERGLGGLREPRAGGDGYANINVRDPNGVRVELMRPRPHLLTPGASSTAAQGGGIPPGFKPIFNGKDLSGWHISETYPQGATRAFRAENGVLLAGQDRPGRGGILLTDKRYKDVEVYMEVKPEPWDTGLFLRSSEAGECYQVNINYPQNIGAIAGEGLAPGGKTIGLARGDWQPYWKKDDWNTIRSRIEGNPPHMVVWLNGTKIIDWTDTVNRLIGGVEDGMIGLQVHGGHRGEVPYGYHRFRNIAIKE